MAINFNSIPDQCRANVQIGNKEFKWQAEIYATGEVILISPEGTRYDTAKELSLAGVDFIEIINHHDLHILQAVKDEELEYV